MNLMMPATIASSHAFALPVGTPANAIIREYAFVPTPRMVIFSIITLYNELLLKHITIFKKITIKDYVIFHLYLLTCLSLNFSDDR